MHFYHFMLKRYHRNYQQAKCILVYFGLFIPVFSLAVILRHDSSIAFHVLLFITGWFTWTFTEYILHRFWMHDNNCSLKMTQIHTHHHKHPAEHVVTNLHRTAMIAVLAVLIVVANYLNNYFTFFAGFCLGIEAYLLVHRIIHLRMGQRVFTKLVRYHIYHHCKYTDTCFGVTVPWWDDLFKTVPKAPKITQRIVDFYFNDDKKKEQSLKTVTAESHHSCHSCDHHCTKTFKDGSPPFHPPL